MTLTKLGLMATTAMLMAGTAMAETKVKVGMITTLSGGGAGLGTVRQRRGRGGDRG